MRNVKKNKRIKSIGLFLLSIISITSKAQQLPLGSWHYHYSYSRVNKCEAGNKYIYAASGLGFFKASIGNYEMSRLSYIDGFHGGEITNLEFYTQKNILVIGYADGFIDILKNEDEIIGIDGFFNKPLQGDKRIVHTCFYGNYAYISTNFGILEIDLNKFEIPNNYSNLGPSGQSVEVKSVAIMNDTIYAGLNDGIIAAPYNTSVNLGDNSSWHRVYTGGACNDLTNFTDTLYFYSNSDTVAFKYYKGSVKNAAIKGHANLVRIQKGRDNSVVFYRQGGITKMFANGSYEVKDVNIIAYGAMDNQNRYWYSTGGGGGVILLLDPTGEIGVEPNGPVDNSSFKMSQNGEFLFCTAGGVSNTFGNAYNPTGFYIYNNFHWISNPPSVHNRGLYDYTYVYYNSVTERTYVGTHTNGVLQFNGNTATNKFDDTNSTLQKDGAGFVRVSGIASDENGNLWVNNYGAANALQTMSKSGAWTAISIPDPNVKNLVIDGNGYKWMILQSGGVFVFDDNKTPSKTSDDRYINLTTAHGLTTNEITSLASDRNGYVWIGTAQGLNVVTNTFDVFTKPKADRFIIEQNGTVGYLLGEETINDICVDGGNRKWFATNNGVFLVEPDGQKVLANYNVQNSPLPNNNVICIGQVGSTGEVFFGTDYGIVSFRSDASTASNSFKEIKIYPNPVKPGYSGVVTIEGLAQDAEIRITDAAGVLVYQAKANGGTATWPCTRLDGTKPNSGVYYVFGINTDGTETAMGKFIFVK